MGEMIRKELAAMTDPELLAYEREHHGDPYMTLAKAKEMQRVALQFWHLGAAKKKADRRGQEEARGRLHEKLFSVRLRCSPGFQSALEKTPSGPDTPIVHDDFRQ